MKKIILLFFLSLAVRQATAQSATDIDKAELKQLLDDRKSKFDAYSTSLEKKSGIFGNKTKNDIRKSNQVLIDIVKTDNRIISNLYRVVDFRNFEKVNTNYDLQRREELLNNLRHAADTLSKQVAALSVVNASLKSKSMLHKWFIYLLSFLSIYLIATLWRRKRKQDESVRSQE